MEANQHLQASMAKVNGFSHPSGGLRMPTVMEAFAFSPFTSIVPLNPGKCEVTSRSAFFARV